MKMWGREYEKGWAPHRLKLRKHTQDYQRESTGIVIMTNSSPAAISCNPAHSSPRHVPPPARCACVRAA